MKLLIFDIWGDYGHFKKFYTTTSPLSFPFPPRPTVAGIIAAIAGIDKEEYLKYFTKDKASIAIRLMKKIKKVRLTENFINTKENVKYLFAKFDSHTLIRIELIKDPAYRIYFSHNDENIYEKIKNMLMNHKSYYTVSLGLSEFVGNFGFVAEIEAELVTQDNEVFYDINSVIPKNDGLKIDFEEDKAYFSAVIPIEMTEGRIVSEYNKVFFEADAKPIKCISPKHWKFRYEGSNEDERIIFI